MLGNMASVSAHLPHENEGGTEDLLQATTNGYHDTSDDYHETSHDTHFEKQSIVMGGKEASKMHSRESCNKMKSHPDNLLIPFPLLAGEDVEQRILCSEAAVILTNYRLFASLPNTFHNIPVRTIEYVEMRELTVVHVNCKFGKVVRICLDTPEDCSELWRYITSLEASQLKTEDLFAFRYFTHWNLSNCNGVVSNLFAEQADCEAAMYVNDMKRMGFNTQTIWRTTEINSKFEVCKTYPKFHIVPAWVSDDDLLEVAQFRSMRRFPSVVWRNKSNGCVIARCSQPEVGWFGWRCEKDEYLLSAIAQAASLDCNVGTNLMSHSVTDIKPQTFLLVDARSYATAVANRAKGGGCECQEYYPACDIQFMGLVNIHAIRKSFQSVRSLSIYGQEQTNWYSTLEKTGWLHYLSALIRSALIIVEAVEIEKRSAIVHCTDGWDRTTQLVSLAQLLLDPYYRTMKGFCVLVEREWLEFGHKFADRCGHSPDKNINEISPVFFQWLDAVHQVMKQYPSAFQFNQSFVVKLAHHVYSCLFGTFFCNSIRERHQLKVKSKTTSVWTLLCGKEDLINILYVANEKKVLYPSHHIRNMEFWENVFIGDTKYPDAGRHLNSSKPADISDSASSKPTDLSDSATSKPVELTDCDSYMKSCNILSNGSVKYIKSDISREQLQMPSATGEKIETAQNVCPSGSDHMFSRCHKPDVSQCGNSCANAVGGETGVVGGIQVNNSVDCATTPDGSISNSQSTCADECTDKCSFTKDTQQLSCNQSDYLEENTNEILDNVDESCMSDSVRTLTGESDRLASFDDSCLHGKGFPEQELDPTLLSMEHHSSGMRNVLLSPDSPRPTNRLPRTKSVPDVMTASLCGDTDVTKQYSSIENNKQINKHIIKDVSKYIDTDGLTVIHNYIDNKLLSIDRKHSQEIAKLQKRIQIERQSRMSLQQQLQQLTVKDGGEYSATTFSDASQDDLLSLSDSANGGRSSVSSLSNDEGWEQVQYDDVQPTRWMPDHLSSSCLHCGQPFSIILRRHHCRKCGGVFCDTCSNYQLSVPDEQLYSPVRVCSKCYDSIATSNT